MAFGNTASLNFLDALCLINHYAMKLSCEVLASLSVPAEILSSFGSQFENGHVEYQDVLERLARADLPDLAITLMDRVGADDSAHL